MYVFKFSAFSGLFRRVGVLLFGCSVFAAFQVTAATFFVNVRFENNYTNHTVFQTFVIRNVSQSADWITVPAGTVPTLNPGQSWSGSLNAGAAPTVGNTMSARANVDTVGNSTGAFNTYTYATGTTWVFAWGAAPIVTYCIDISTLNGSFQRQRYQVYKNGIGQGLSDWIPPGGIFSYSYSSTIKPIFQVERITDGDPPVTDYSRTIDTTDAAWHDCSTAGTANTGTDISVVGASSLPAINWPVSPTTVAHDEVLKTGFTALYGQAAANQDGEMMILSGLKAGVAAVDSSVIALGTKLDTGNGALATLHGDNATIESKLDSHTGLLQSVTNFLAGNNSVLQGIAAGQATEATLRGLTNLMLGATNLLGQINSNLVANAGGHLLDFASTNLLNDFLNEKSAFSSNYIAGVASAVTGVGDNIAAGFSDGSTVDGASGEIGSAWVFQVSRGGPFVDLNPVNKFLLSSAMLWVKGLFTWLLFAAFLIFIFKIGYKAFTDVAKTPQTHGANVSVAGIGSTVPAGVAAMIVIMGVLAAVAGFIFTFAGGAGSTVIDVVKGNPLIGSYTHLTQALYLMNRCFPVDIVFYLFFLGCFYRIAILVIVMFAAATIKGAVALFALGFISSSFGGTALRVNNGYSAEVLVQLSGGNTDTNVISGSVIGKGGVLERDVDGDASSVVMAWASNGSGGWIPQGVLGTWGAFGWTEDTGELNLSLSVAPDGSILLTVVPGNSIWWAIGQAWVLGFALLSTALGIYIVKQIRGQSHGEL